MKKRTLSFLLILAVLLSLAAPIAAAAPASVSLVLDGKPLSLNPQPYIQNGITMVPLRALAEAIGFTVEWQGNYGIRIQMEHKALGIRATLYQAGDQFYLRRESRQEIQLDTPPVIRNDRTFVPLRAVCEAFDYKVQWNEASRTVTLLDGRKIPMLDGLQPDTEFSLLQDRLTVKMPAKAYDMAVHYGDIMGAYASDDFETTLELFENGQILQLSAQELYAYSTGDLEKDFQSLQSQSAQQNDYHVGTVVQVGTLSYLPYAPARYDETHGGLVAGALVRAADNTLISVQIAADRYAMVYAAQCVQMADLIIATLQPGARQLPTAAQQLTVGSYRMELSEGYVATLRRGMDFDVQYIYKMAAIDQPASNFGLYLGNHPSYSETKPTQAIADTALGKAITWNLYAEQPGVWNHDTYAETLIETGTNDWDSYIHIFATPVSEADWNEIRAMVRTLSPGV